MTRAAVATGEPRRQQGEVPDHEEGEEQRAVSVGEKGSPEGGAEHDGENDEEVSDQLEDADGARTKEDVDDHEESGQRTERYQLQGRAERNVLPDRRDYRSDQG